MDVTQFIVGFIFCLVILVVVGFGGYTLFSVLSALIGSGMMI